MRILSPNFKKKGFTLIELIVVIVLLGILAVVALPRFISAEVDARQAALSGLEGALHDAKKFTRSRYKLDGLSGAGSVTLDGQAVDVLAGGNPAGTAAGIGAAVEVSGFSGAYAAGVGTFTITGYSGANCQVTYTATTGAIVRTESGC